MASSYIVGGIYLPGQDYSGSLNNEFTGTGTGTGTGAGASNVVVTNADTSIVVTSSSTNGVTTYSIKAVYV